MIQNATFSRPAFRARTIIAISALLLLPLAGADNDDKNGVAITSAVIGFAKVTVTGSNFGFSPPVVTLAGTKLPVASVTPGEIVATLTQVPHAGSYRLTVSVGNGLPHTASIDITISPKVIAGGLRPDGSIFSGFGFTAVRNGPGSYSISFPPGTWQPNAQFPIPSVAGGFTAKPVVSGLVAFNDGGAGISVDFGGVDSYVLFTMTQMY